MIVKHGKKFLVLDHTGKRVLGSHPTWEKAKAQLRAIELSKMQRSKKK